MRNFLKSVLSIAFILNTLSLAKPVQAAPVATNLVDFQGNLDPIQSQSTGISVFVYDWTSSSHRIFISGTQVAENTWQMSASVDGAELSGGQAGMQVELGSVQISYQGDGQREEPVPASDLTVSPVWSNGTRGAVNISFAELTQIAAEGHSTYWTVHNGCGTPCSQNPSLDFDGDGSDDRGIWRPAIGFWAILGSNSTFIWKQWGLPGDYPVPGDYDGDGKSDLAVWRPSNGVWYICPSSADFDCNQAGMVQFGLPGDYPITADFNGDGVTDMGIWRESTGQYFRRFSQTEVIIESQWGLSGDIPLGTRPKKSH